MILCVSMEHLYHYLCITLFIVLTIKFFIHKKQNLPPSPFSLPIIGHLHLIKSPLYQSLATLLSNYGPILYLRLGCSRVLVTSSPSAIEECFTKNDIIFANRPRTMAGDIFTYNYKSYVWAPYGPLWRNLRRLSVVEFFSSNSVQKFSYIREEEVGNLIRRLLSEVSTANGSRKVELKYFFSLLTMNVMLRLAAGKGVIEEYAKDMEVEKIRLREFKNVFFPSMGTNICDFFPFLRWIGFRGIEKNMEELQRRRDEYVQNLVDGVRSKKTRYGVEEGNKNSSLIERLLSFPDQDPNFYSNDVIKSMAVMMFTAGTETTSVTIEWAMSLLLNHPEALQKVRAEIDRHVGHERLLNDSDLDNLPYTLCVVKETLRLYPPAPVLLPHFSSEYCTVSGYEIPKATQLIVNVWEVQRDPSVWEEAALFRPERFEGTNFEEKGSGVKYLPFGHGRRVCPGSNMGLRLVLLALGAAIQCFEWEKIGSEMVDMTPGTGLALSRARPLDALCRPRFELIEFLSQF